MIMRLEDDLAEFVQALVSSGRFSSEEAVVSAALRQMKDKSVKKAEMRRLILGEATTDESASSARLS